MGVRYAVMCCCRINLVQPKNVPCHMQHHDIRPIQNTVPRKSTSACAPQSIDSTTNSMLGTIHKKYCRTRAVLRKVQVRGVPKTGLLTWIVLYISCINLTLTKKNCKYITFTENSPMGSVLHQYFPNFCGTTIDISPSLCQGDSRQKKMVDHDGTRTHTIVIEKLSTIISDC